MGSHLLGTVRHTIHTIGHHGSQEKADHRL